MRKITDKNEGTRISNAENLMEVRIEVLNKAKQQGLALNNVWTVDSQYIWIYMNIYEYIWFSVLGNCIWMQNNLPFTQPRGYWSL